STADSRSPVVRVEGRLRAAFRVFGIAPSVAPTPALPRRRGREQEPRSGDGGAGGGKQEVGSRRRGAGEGEQGAGSRGGGAGGGKQEVGSRRWEAGGGKQEVGSRRRGCCLWLPPPLAGEGWGGGKPQPGTFRQPHPPLPDSRQAFQPRS